MTNSLVCASLQSNHRDERDLRSALPTEATSHRPLARSVMPAASSGQGGGGSGGSSGGQGEEEWKSIHTMLNCISAMVDKTKRAITILQQRGVEPQPPNYGELTPATLMEIRRQTEEKVAEFKRNAEDAVNQVFLLFPFLNFVSVFVKNFVFFSSGETSSCY